MGSYRELEPWLPQPFFKNRLVINVGPYAGRRPVLVRIYDIGGRLVIAFRARSATTAS